MASDSAQTNSIRYVQDLPLSGRHWYIVLVSSMEQIIGATLSTVVGIIIPMLNMLLHPELSATVQGLMGATGLVGIALGSAVIGPLGDREGYLWWFRLCAILIIIGCLAASIAPNPVVICCGLLIAGFGLGGGYTLDSEYISELMPDKWRSFMVGVAKASCSFGFLLPAVFAVVMLRIDPSPEVWRYTLWFTAGLGLITLLMRIRWTDSPGWLMAKGRFLQAQDAAKSFFGKNVGYCRPTVNVGSGAKSDFASLFKGRNLLRVIYSGIPWACEGLGVYGIGVFLPVLIMALGIDNSSAEGITKIIHSVELTAVINFCIIPGFVIGLLIVDRMNHATMLWTGFVGAAFGMALLLMAHLLHWPVWVSIGSFMLFEIMLNAGPHLVTYIIPTVIYPVSDRGAGAGIASFLGKTGAIVGVFFMPMLLKAGGMTLVIIVTISAMLAGAIISIIFSRLLGLNK